jgi:hypothetical protein
MDIKGMLLNKTTIGGSLVLVGAVITFGANFRMLNKVLFTLPVLNAANLERHRLTRRQLIGQNHRHFVIGAAAIHGC